MQFPRNSTSVMNTIVFLTFQSKRFPSTLVLPVSLGWQVDLCQSSCSHFPQIPQFLRSLTRLIHTNIFILNLNLNFYLIFQIFQKKIISFTFPYWLCRNYSSTSISHNYFLKYGPLLYSLPKFIKKILIIPIHLIHSALSNFFHMLLLCNFCHIDFNYAYFSFLFMITIFLYVLFYFTYKPIIFMKSYLSFKFRPLAHISCKFSQFSGHLPQFPVILQILSFSCRADIVTTWVTEGARLSNQVSPIT
jgi:hypothetical protein